MTIFQLFKNINPFVKPYKWLIVGTLTMTLIGALASQVNAIVLDKTVDSINALIPLDPDQWPKALKLLTVISAVLLGKELLAALISFAQKYYGEKMRILVSKDLAQAVIERMLTFRVAYFSKDDNEPGKLQTRIDRGVESLSATVKNFFIDILPLFTSAIFALVLMFMANVYVGIVALVIVPIYFWITYREAKRLSGWRRDRRAFREAKSHGIMNIIESITVIKSFNRERIEGDKQLALQNQLTDHRVGHCTSNELYKYVLNDEAVGAFAGRVLVRKDAQQTVSHETNQNLCASQQARMFTQPMLEIYADDVKCSHGSTVGQLNDSALFYMRQRGIPEKEARLLLEHAFVNEVIEKMEIEPLRDRLSHLVEMRFRGKLNICEGCKLCK